jgi:pseudaminic acid biosynthesis-associated methylase
LDTQEFWKGDFGNDYTERNVGLEENNHSFFWNIINHNWNDHFINIKSIIEFGCGSGMNLIALSRALPCATQIGCEINQFACKKANENTGALIINSSIIDFPKTFNADLILTKGVLIHIPTNEIEDTYKVIYNASNRYILICEYYNPVEVEIPYRGNAGKLWKRDYIRPFLDYGCSLIDYGFVSKYDDSPQDDLTWALFEKGKGINIHEEVSI